MTHPPALTSALTRFLRRLGCGLAWAACALALAAPAQAAPLSAADEQAVRAAVQGQLAAFAADDAALAFSWAAPNVREALGTAAGFLAMVREAYPVVYRPASVAFLKPDNKDGQVFQRVQMVDAAGEAWLATYSLQRGGKGWLITGCVVVANKGRMA
ncbi:MAG: DUF4864 domain-containing protein [Polaromonas sp.]|nr:DUF4864 domain-containing protein [Polaromonas sp.]